MGLTLCVTHDCNLRCAYCYAGEKRRVAMSRETAFRAIDFALERHRATRPPGTPFVLGFFGGEPLLEWDLVRAADDRAAESCRRAGIALGRTLTTNGTLLDPERLAWLGERRYRLGVSIDGGPSLHDRQRRFPDGSGSFAAAARHLALLGALRPAPELFCTVDPATVRLVPEAIRDLASRTSLRIALNPNYEAAWDEAATAAFEAAWRSLADLVLASYRAGRPMRLTWFEGKVQTLLLGGYRACDRCDPVRRELACAPSGNLYPCAALVGNDDRADLLLGNVRDGFDPAALARTAARVGNRNEACRTCPAAPRCMNWCFCNNWHATGSPDLVSPLLCLHERLSIELADRIAETLLAERNPAFLAVFAPFLRAAPRDGTEPRGGAGTPPRRNAFPA